jgi:hypothetical protein
MDAITELRITQYDFNVLQLFPWSLSSFPSAIQRNNLKFEAFMLLTSGWDNAA